MRLWNIPPLSFPQKLKLFWITKIILLHKETDFLFEYLPGDNTNHPPTVFYGETNVVLDYLPSNNRDHPPAVFYGETNVVLYCCCWYKVSGVKTHFIIIILKKSCYVFSDPLVVI